MLHFRQLIQRSLFCLSALAGSLTASATAVTPASPRVTQNFDSMWDGNEATLTLPEGWRIDRNLTAPHSISSWESAASTVMYSGGASLAPNAKNGTWNFGSSVNPSDRAVGGLSTTVSNGTRGINVMTSITNCDSAMLISHLSISYNIEKYRKGDNSAGFSVQMYYSADGTNWRSAGDSFRTYIPADDATAGAAEVPIGVTSVNNADLHIHLLAGNTIYLAWNIGVDTGSSPNKAQGLAIDDVSITATFADSDPTWQEKVFTPSGIYLRGIGGDWNSLADWEFNKIDDHTYTLTDKTLSGTFKIADSSWGTINYGSNGTDIAMDMPYQLASNVNDNISCGSNTYVCKTVRLTISNGSAVLLLESDKSTDGLTSVYVIGDNNGWNYMDGSGELKLDTVSNLFKGRITLKASADGLAHWRICQRLGCIGPWGTESNLAEDNTSGTLVSGATESVATAPGTYDFIFNLSTGAYQLTKVAASMMDLTVSPRNTIIVPRLPAKVRILSLNNSLIHYNDQPAVFNAIAEAMNKDATWTKHTLLGKSLATHWDEGEGLAEDGLPGAKMMVRSQPWTHIILQEQSSLPRTNFTKFRENIRKWVSYIRDNCPNPNAIIIMPVNWAYYGDWTNFTAFNNTFISNYMAVAKEFGIVVCPVVNAYQDAYNRGGADNLATWFQDDRHPTDKSTYMAACMEYSLIFGEDANNITYVPATLKAADADTMRAYASRAMLKDGNVVNHHEGTVRLTAEVTDEYGVRYQAPNVTYSVDGGGNVSPEGLFTSNGTLGTFHITAKSGTFTCTDTITVADAVTTPVPVLPAIHLNADTLFASENFNMLNPENNVQLPESWRIDRQTSAPRRVGNYADADSTTMYSGGTMLPSNAKNGTWNFGATDDENDRAVGGITTGIANGSRAINVYTHLKNTGTKRLEKIRVGYDLEKYRKGSNAAGFTVQLYYSYNGKTWNPAGDDFKTVFKKDDATVGYSNAPGTTVHNEATLPVGIDAGVDLYLAWNYSVTSGTNCAAAMAIGIDNVTIEASLPDVPDYKYHFYVNDQTGYASLGAYIWGDSEVFGPWPGHAPIDEQVINGTVWKVFGHNEDSGTYSLIFNNWNQGSQLPDVAVKGGQDYWFVITPTGAQTVTSVKADATVNGGLRYDGHKVYAGQDAVFTVFCINGQTVGKTRGTAIDLSSLKNGVYVVRVATKQGTGVLKIVH